jgi:hypothetical protein
VSLLVEGLDVLNVGLIDVLAEVLLGGGVALAILGLEVLERGEGDGGGDEAGDNEELHGLCEVRGAGAGGGNTHAEGKWLGWQTARLGQEHVPCYARRF